MSAGWAEFEARVGGVVEVVVDEHDVVACSVEERRGDAGSKPGLAVDMDRAVGDVAEAVEQLVQRDAGRVVQVFDGELAVETNVEDGRVDVVVAPRQSSWRRRRAR